MKLDAHQHFWTYSDKTHPWIPQGTPLQRDWLPADLEPLLQAADVDGCIAVEARASLDESRTLLQFAEQAPFIKGVVGWADLMSPNLSNDLREFGMHPKFCGVRFSPSGDPATALLQPEFVRGIEVLHQYGLTFDLLISPKHLPSAGQLARQVPQVKFVIDHLAGPSIKSGELAPWSDLISEVATARNVFCKLSGMVTLAEHREWKQEQFQPYVDVALEAFGPDRLMYGSDWPVCLLAADYQKTHDVLANCLASQTAEVQSKIFGLNAARFYDIGG
jgi:L-fuconolactonase